MKTIRTATLEIAYEESGQAAGRPVILLHGFPDDVHAYDGVAPLLAALGLERAVLAGYDWGGRAACVVAALWPQRAAGLVTIGGYNIQNITEAAKPASPATEYRRWYQWYFQTERGRAGLAANRGPLCRLLWELWSPNYRFDDATYQQTAASFDNPDFVEVVIQSYRHRYGVAPGDPALDTIEDELARQPPITVPTIALQGEADGVSPPDRTDRAARHFTGPYQSRVMPRAGHFLPREVPEAVVQAISKL